MSRSKYEKTIEGLSDDMEYAIQQCKAILQQDIPEGMPEDKMHNVLKGKRMAAEDAVYYAKQIDKFERELNGEEENEVQQETSKELPSIKKFTKK